MIEFYYSHRDGDEPQPQQGLQRPQMHRRRQMSRGGQRPGESLAENRRAGRTSRPRRGGRTSRARRGGQTSRPGRGDGRGGQTFGENQPLEEASSPIRITWTCYDHTEEMMESDSD